jgi:hypothetical protein
MVGKVALILALLLVPPLALRLAGKPLTGTFVGMPYDFTAPSLGKVKRTAWNPSDDRVLAPHVYGWGYSVNVHAIGRRLGMIGR